MYKKFLKYNWEQILEEKSFISWVVGNKNSKEWIDFIEKYPGFKKEAAKAREIISVLHDKYDEVDEKTVIELWRNIERFNFHAKQKERIFKIRTTLSWAATIILLFAIGSIAIIYLRGERNGYQFISDFDFEGKDAHIVLSTGDNILLSRQNSKIDWNRANEQVIINDSIINIALKAQDENSLNEVVMPFGKKSQLILPDGTEVWINSGSRLAFPSVFSGNKREVHLEGEACFKVANRDNIPFLVSTGEMEIKVLGTYFNVSAYPGNELVETVLINGSVELNKSRQFRRETVLLNPNQKAEFSKLENEFTVSDEPNVYKYVAWVQGWLEYRRESLNSVLEKLERYYNVKFHLPPDFPADDKISGKLDLNGSLENVMLVLADAAGIEFEIMENKVFVKKKNY